MLCRVLCVFLFINWTGPRAGGPLYETIWWNPLGFLDFLFQATPGVRLPPFRILFLALAPLCFLQAGALRKRAWPMDAAIVVSLATIALTFLWGMARGGSAYQSYYQLTSFLTLLLVGAMLLCVVRSSGDLKALGLTILGASLVRGGLACYLYIAHVRDGTIRPFPWYVTTHDDSVLFVGGMLVAVCWALSRRTWTAWGGAALVSVVLLYAMKANNRRLAWVELTLALAFAFLLLPRRRRRRWLQVAAPLVLVYVLVGWGRSGAVFAPLRAFYTTSGEGEDASSFARNEENLNLVFTFLQHPLLGTGWGHPYIEVSSYYPHFENFPQYPYMPHNSLVGMVGYSGAVGLLGIWVIVPITAFLAARAYRRARRSVDRAAAMAAVCILPAYAVQAYGDIGFLSNTGGLLVSIAVAVAGKVSVWTGAWPAAAGRRPRQMPDPAP